MWEGMDCTRTIVLHRFNEYCTVKRVKPELNCSYCFTMTYYTIRLHTDSILSLYHQQSAAAHWKLMSITLCLNILHIPKIPLCDCNISVYFQLCSSNTKLSLVPSSLQYLLFVTARITHKLGFVAICVWCDTLLHHVINGNERSSAKP